MITCDECGGDCCKRIAIQIEKPKTRDDIEDLKWYLYHDRLAVYIDNEGDWLVQVPVKCKHLINGKCSIYSGRPPVCRKAKVSECQRNVKETVKVFRTPEDVDTYLKTLKF